MSKNSSSKYYQKKQRLQKMVQERYQDLSEEESKQKSTKWS